MSKKEFFPQQYHSFSCSFLVSNLFFFLESANAQFGLQSVLVKSNLLFNFFLAEVTRSPSVKDILFPGRIERR